MNREQKLEETLAGEFSRLVSEYGDGERQNSDEAWNLIADFAVANSEAIRRALTASGYRILGPGELDAETLEAAADAMEIVPSFGDGKWAARHIRALKDKRE